MREKKNNQLPLILVIGYEGRKKYQLPLALASGYK